MIVYKLSTNFIWRYTTYSKSYQETFLYHGILHYKNLELGMCSEKEKCIF